MANQELTAASNYFDLQGLDKLRQKAQGNSKDSVREVANQFESMFASMLIKSMRKTNTAFETESPFNNKQTKFYTDMQDSQLALDISRHGSLGLADALVRQLDPNAIGRPKLIPVDNLSMPNDKNNKQMDLEKKSTSFDLNKLEKSSALMMPERNKPDGNSFVITPSSAPVTATNKETEFTDKKSFIDTLLPYAKKTAQVLGISPMVLIAQSALETGWGKKIIKGEGEASSFNLFNIKANKNWSGEKVAKESLEIEGGVGVKRRSNFRSYKNLADSFTDYGNFISSSQRYQGALQPGTNDQRYIEELQQAGYATDPKYAEKIKTIMQDDSFKKIVAGGEFNG